MVDSVIIKLQRKIMEQEFIWHRLQKYLSDENIRMVYKMLGIKMPRDLKETLRT